MNVQDEIKELKERIVELEEQVKGDKEFTQSNNEYLGIDEFGDECSHELGYFVKKLLLKKMKGIGNVYHLANK